MSSERKDEFGTTLEQLRKIQAATRACIRAIQDARNRAWEWRDRRDELRSTTPTVHDQISEERIARDELNVEVQQLKQLRDAESEKIRKLSEQLHALRGNRTSQRDAMSLEELQRRFRELEWKQQTTPMSVDEERVLLNELDSLTKAIEQASQRKIAHQDQTEDMEKLWHEIQAARDQSQEYHEQMIALVDEAQQKHQQILELSKSLGPAQSEIDEAHQMYVQCLQEADEMRTRLEDLKGQETELRQKLDEIKKTRKVARAARERQALERLADQARTKQQTGQKLTIQELRALMEVNGLD